MEFLGSFQGCILELFIPKFVIQIGGQLRSYECEYQILKTHIKSVAKKGIYKKTIHVETFSQLSSIFRIFQNIIHRYQHLQIKMHKFPTNPQKSPQYSLQKTLECLDLDNIQLLNQLTNPTNEHETDFIHSENGFRQLLESNAELQYKIAICEAELDFMKQKSHDKDHQIRKMKEILKKKDHQSGDLQKMIKQLRGKIGTLKQGYRNMNDQLKKVQNEEKVMRSQKLDVIQEKNALNQRKAQLEAEYHEILEELQTGLEIDISGGQALGSETSLLYESEDIDIEIEKLRASNHQLSKQAIRLEKKLYSLKKSTDSEHTQRSSMRLRIKQLNQKITKLDFEEKSLTSQLEKHREQETSKEQAKHALAENNEEIVTLYTKLEKLQRQLEKKKDHIEKLQRKYKSVAMEESSLRKRLLVQKESAEVEVRYKSQLKSMQKSSYRIIESEYGEAIEHSHAETQEEHLQRSQFKEKLALGLGRNRVSSQHQPGKRNYYQIQSNRDSEGKQGSELKSPFGGLINRFEKIKNRSTS